MQTVGAEVGTHRESDPSVVSRKENVVFQPDADESTRRTNIHAYNVVWGEYRNRGHVKEGAIAKVTPRPDRCGQKSERYFYRDVNIEMLEPAAYLRRSNSTWTHPSTTLGLGPEGDQIMAQELDARSLFR